VERLRGEHQFSKTGASQAILSTCMYDDEFASFAEQRLGRDSRRLSRDKRIAHRVLRVS